MHHIAVVTIKVKKDCIDGFIAAVQENARQSRKEAGVLRFDVLRKKDADGEFALIEAYKTVEDQAAHRKTAHFLEFKEKVGPLLEEPYTVNNYGIIP
jgi:quinol monooxygenase YgiN